MRLRDPGHRRATRPWPAPADHAVLAPLPGRLPPRGVIDALADTTRARARGRRVGHRSEVGPEHERRTRRLIAPRTLILIGKAHPRRALLILAGAQRPAPHPTRKARRIR